MEDPDQNIHAPDPPRDSREMPTFLEAMAGPPPTVKVVKSFCVECQQVLAPEEMKCHNCAVNKPTGFK